MWVLGPSGSFSGRGAGKKLLQAGENLDAVLPAGDLGSPRALLGFRV